MIRHRFGILGAALLAAGALSATTPSGAAPAPAGCSYISASARPVLAPGQSGAAVKQAQCLSNVWGGVPKLAIDGVFGTATLRKIEWIQACHGLPQDGVVTAETWQVLYHPALDCYLPYPS